MLSINTIARVIVNVVRPAAQPTSWDTGLLLVKDAAFADAKRLRTYANSTEAAAGLIADGFDNTTEAYKAAQKYFASSPSTGRLLVSCYSASETSVEALDAILQLTSDFYGIALINARQIRAFLYVDGTNMPRCILRKAGIRPIPDPPEPLLLHEPEGSLWRLRCDLTILLRQEEKQTHPTRLGAVTIAPAVVVRTG